MGEEGEQGGGEAEIATAETRRRTEDFEGKEKKTKEFFNAAGGLTGRETTEREGKWKRAEDTRKVARILVRPERGFFDKYGPELMGLPPNVTEELLERTRTGGKVTPSERKALLGAATVESSGFRGEGLLPQYAVGAPPLPTDEQGQALWTGPTVWGSTELPSQEAAEGGPRPMGEPPCARGGDE